MRPRPVLAASAVLTALALTLSPATASALTAGPGDPPVVSDEHAGALDTRNAVTSAVAPTKAQLAAVADVVAAAGGARVTWDARFGTPRTVLAAGRDLTGPAAGTAPERARAWLTDHAALLGLSADGVAALQQTGDHVLPGTGTHVVTFAQTVGGVQLTRGGSLTVAVRSNGAILSYAGQTTRETALAQGFSLTSAQALTKVAGVLAAGTGLVATVTGEQAGYDVFDKGPFAASSYVKQAAFPTQDGVRPAFRVLFVKALDEAWDVVVDGATGEVLYRNSVVQHLATPEGTVYRNFPGAKGGGAPEKVSFGPTAESPSGWVDPTGVAGLPGPTTLGNNASTYANYSNFLAPADTALRPVSPTAQFNYPYGANWTKTNGATVPPSYALDLDPATTNLFFHHNRIHDEFYALGFTETAGNFETDGGDPILGLVHAGAVSGGAPTYTGRDNAYMLTLPDGIPPWSGMFLWEPINDAFEGPYTDGNFDAGVIEHEYAHGLSNRYVSAEDNALGAHQSGSMGEGWGDWYALNYLHREGLDTGSVVGEHVTGNAERGIRNWSYDDNPTGYGDIGYDLGGPEVHSDGEIWTTVLWDLRKALVARFGQAEGSDIAARAVTDAMPLSPVDPSFLDMRDAIVKAVDNRHHARADYDVVFDLVQTAFARRGAGADATTQGGADVDPQPGYAHVDSERNGTLTGTVLNASTGQPVADAKVVVGLFEARVTPLRRTSSTGGFSAPMTAGTYTVTVQAPGFGARTFEGVSVTAGSTTGLQLSLEPNLASSRNGATVVSATNPGTGAMLDDTEASTWKATKGTGHAVVKLAKPSTISTVAVSAFTTSRFEGLKSFTVQVSNDGLVWKTVKSGPAFSYGAPRPTAPDLHLKTFQLASPVKASFVRFWADEALGETKTTVQVAELQVFAKKAKGVEPLPPAPLDEPVRDAGTITVGNPGSDQATGVTMADFEGACAVPASQGTDAWVTKLPESFGDGQHRVAVKGVGVNAPYDIDLYFYDATCARTGSAASSAADESGSLPSGTAYVLTQLWSGAATSFELLAEDTA